MKLYKKILMGLIISIILALTIWLFNSDLLEEDISSRAKKVLSPYQKIIRRDLHGGKN